MAHGCKLIMAHSFLSSPSQLNAPFVLSCTARFTPICPTLCSIVSS